MKLQKSERISLIKPLANSTPGEADFALTIRRFLCVYLIFFLEKDILDDSPGGGASLPPGHESSVCATADNRDARIRVRIKLSRENAR